MSSSFSRAACAALVVVTAAACNSTPPPPSTTPAATPAPAPAAPQGPRLYVSDETGTGVVAIDPETKQVVQRIAVGKRPRGIRLSHDGSQLFVALSGSPIGGPGVDESKLPPADREADGIGIVDVKSGSVVQKFKSGNDPESFAISSDGKTLFVSNEDEQGLSVLDLATGKVVKQVKVGEEPEGVTVRPDGKVVYVTSEGSGDVTAIDTSTYEVLAHIKTGPRPRSIAFTKDGATGFVSSENSASLTVFDAATHKVKKTIDFPKKAGAEFPPRPMGQVLSPDGTRLYVSLGRAKGIGIVDTAQLTVTGIIDDVGARPWGIGISADGKKLYTANGPSGDVSIVDIASGKVDAKINTGGSPWGVAVGAR